MRFYYLIFLVLRICKAQWWFVNLQEAAEELAPHLEIILQHLMCAFGKYQVFFFFFFCGFVLFCFVLFCFVFSGLCHDQVPYNGTMVRYNAG
jgi:hypothetical protein